jgi:hypothetical protein
MDYFSVIFVSVCVPFGNTMPLLYYKLLRPVCIVTTVSYAVVVHFQVHVFEHHDTVVAKRRGRVCEALFLSVYLSMDRSVPFCHLTHTTKTCLPRVSTVK